MKPKLFRISTVPLSLNILLKGQLHYLSNYFDVTGISGKGSDLDQVEKREGVRIHAISMQRPISVFKDLQALFRLYRYFRKERPQIIHSITPKAGLLSMAAGKMAGVPVRIHTFTGLVFPYRTGMMQRLLMNMDRLLCYCATHIYPEGEGVKKDLQQYGITNKPLRVLGNGNVNGVDVDYFSPLKIREEERLALREKLAIAPNDFVFLYVGRLVRDKGVNELVQAFKSLKSSDLDSVDKEYSSVKLLLVGPYEHDLDPLQSETLREIEQNPAIISVGYQEFVRPFFAISQCLVFPSYREGFPNVVLQAGAMELPSVVTDISGSNEIIQQGKNGLVIPVKEVNALQQAMEYCLQNPQIIQEMKAWARTWVVEHYDQEKLWTLIKNEYIKFLNTRGKTS